MAEFYPNTVIKILKDVPLDASYTDVLDFASETAQNQYFSSKSKYVFNNVSYQRVNYSVDSARPPLTCTVPMNADNLYDCNYIMFQNANYGTKWFYAYIVNVGFVSANVSKISYVLDDYQTWLFDFTVGESYVLREHTNDDTIGSNLEPEPFTITNYVACGYDSDSESFSNAEMCVAVTEEPSGNYDVGEWVDNKFFTGAKLHYFELGSEDLVTYLQSFQQGKAEAILYIQLVPLSSGGVVKQLTNSSRPVSLDGYTPDNNKLLTYPYCKLAHINSSGQGNEYKYELFKTPTQISFNSTLFRQPVPEILTYPLSYMGSNLIYPNIYQYTTTLTNFPFASWANNTFSNWYAQNQAEINQRKNYQQLQGAYKIVQGAASAIAGGVAIAASPVTGGVTGVVGGATFGHGLLQISQGFNEIQNSENQLQALLIDMKVIPDTLSGGVSSSYSMYMDGKLGNHFYQMTILSSQAERIDTFFSMYGYATNKVKIPNLTGRSNFNYVKLQQPYITGSIPVESMINIKKIFSNGVRIWHNTATFMNYNVKNNIKESSNDNNETT